VHLVHGRYIRQQHGHLTHFDCFCASE
jgi:hypothetical protein